MFGIGLGIGDATIGFGVFIGSFLVISGSLVT